ncbi:MAG: hypothetical protein CM15mP109_00420 [Candidatus Dadabacteria bacterium]|nr:MAG: hypothetical protein CM15mP109_00420 [Candidatus Dadabacteria bacterium]
MNFPNPVGLCCWIWVKILKFQNIINLGFGFSEVGTVTPLPQKKGILNQEYLVKNNQAIINRLGFNNDGFEIVKKD